MALTQGDLEAIAAGLTQWLVREKRATNVQTENIVVTKRGSEEVGFTISFIWQGQERSLRYIIRRADGIPDMIRLLRVESQGELLVQMPNESRTGLLQNIIYYPVRYVTPGSAVRSSR